jgi:hypothetical protein
VQLGRQQAVPLGLRRRRRGRLSHENAPWRLIVVGR